MLQEQQAVVEQLIDRAVALNADYAAHIRDPGKSVLL
jgi:hypothetical protein